MYRRIIEPVMGYSFRQELVTATRVAHLYRDRWRTCLLLGEVTRLIRDRVVCVLGPLAIDPPDTCDVVIVVDGIENINPGFTANADIFVGDADSSDVLLLQDLCDFKYCFIHFHSDNIYYLTDILIKNMRIIPTSQACCAWPIFGVGGFTDGDRAALLPMLMGADRVLILGYDFSQPVYTHKKRFLNKKYKHKKLFLSKKILINGSNTLGYRLIYNRIHIEAMRK